MGCNRINESCSPEHLPSPKFDAQLYPGLHSDHDHFNAAGCGNNFLFVSKKNQYFSKEKLIIHVCGSTDVSLRATTPWNHVESNGRCRSDGRHVQMTNVHLLSLATTFSLRFCRSCLIVPGRSSPGNELIAYFQHGPLLPRVERSHDDRLRSGGNGGPTETSRPLGATRVPGSDEPSWAVSKFGASTPAARIAARTSTPLAYKARASALT